MKLCLCYLARERDGMENFAEAYSRIDAGIAHELVLVGKGRAGYELAAEYRAKLGQALMYSVVNFSKRSLSTFYAVAEAFDCFDTFCFLNSWSRPLAEGWLAKLCEPMAKGVRLAGATASWESFRSNRPSLFNRILPEFPNPHLRTNAFVCSRQDALRLLPWCAPWLQLEYLAEAGPRSITRKVWSERGQVAVVGRDGYSTMAQGWKELGTFRRGAQEGLLVADNKTEVYAMATAEIKESR